MDKECRRRFVRIAAVDQAAHKPSRSGTNGYRNPF
jgi:hypothetical protein